ncbi:FecCD family ABC transporter permease [Fulvimarina manganoxydans]|uniref:FecCD family ABC transporter permease n=1 Tax=Fulvimarina manganoxydans TaxID=937218 RepID=UPI000A010638|nr:iron ABC transporter permease [Fulvimarina manganoxydans]
MVTPPDQFVAASRQRCARRRRGLVALLLALLLSAAVVTLTLGRSYVPITDVLRILLGGEVPGATFTVEVLRLPRTVLSILAGLSFGLGGVAFQIMLRNPLASPDIIGISSGASAAAVFAIVGLSLTGPVVSILAVLAGLAVAMLIYGLAVRNGEAGTRLILVGIGVSAMLQSLISYVLLNAPAWNRQEAIRWLSGSVNGARLDEALPLLTTFIVFGLLLLSRSRELETLRLGDDMAAALGTPVSRSRIVIIISAVSIIAVATAVTGPIAFVAFLAGPIAAHIVGANGSLLLPSSLVGAVLVLVADFAGQFLLPARYPVGVVTGVLGAPYLIYLIIRVNRTGRAL